MAGLTMERAKELLQVVHLSGKEDLEADNLPYGEQRRLEIARHWRERRHGGHGPPFWRG